MQQISNLINVGWPKENKDRDLLPYFRKRFELSEESGCIFWGYRVIVPKSLQANVVKFLHETHMGIIKMKYMARETCWWPTQSQDLELVAKSCDACRLTSQSPNKQELIPWKRSDEVWSRIHIDFFGPIMNRSYLVIVYSTSKWVECIDMGNNTTTRAVIQVLREIFSRFGLPTMIVSDNGKSFVSKEFKNFLFQNGIEQRTSPVGNPATNGQAENAVKTIKTAIKRNMLNKPLSDFNVVLSRFLFDYRNTVHATTGVSPAFIMFNKRKLRTRLDILNEKRTIEMPSKKNIKNYVKRSQENQKACFKGSKKNKFKIKDIVFIKDYSTPGRVFWKKGSIVKIIGKQTYICKTVDQNLWKRHANQIVLSEKANVNLTTQNIEILQSHIPKTINNDNLLDIEETVVTDQIMMDNVIDRLGEANSQSVSADELAVTPPRYNLRQRKK